MTGDELGAKTGTKTGTKTREKKGSKTSTSTGKKTATKGRGSLSNHESRFVKFVTLPVDDGWQQCQHEGEIENKVRTQLYVDKTRQLITRNKSPDIPFDQSINPYKGCEHGCVYCFARPTHAYLDLSPGLDFETKIFRKSDPAKHLAHELNKPNYQCSTIAMGTNTDPYQPAEKSQRVTREILEALLAYRHPVSIVTKGKLILRDLDLLQEFAAHGLVNVNISVTTLDNALKTKLEPRTMSPAARLRTIAELRNAGIPTGVLVAPVIPFINDHELEEIVQASAAAGALAAKYILLRLPLEVKPLMEEWLEGHYPQRAGRVMAAIRDTRGGKAYRAQWHTRMVGQGEMAGLLNARFKNALKSVGLKDRELPILRTDLFKPPARQPASSAQKSQAGNLSSGQLPLF